MHLFPGAALAKLRGLELGGGSSNNRNVLSPNLEARPVKVLAGLHPPEAPGENLLQAALLVFLGLGGMGRPSPLSLFLSFCLCARLSLCPLSSF